MTTLRSLYEGPRPNRHQVGRVSTLKDNTATFLSPLCRTKSKIRLSKLRAKKAGSQAKFCPNLETGLKRFILRVKSRAQRDESIAGVQRFNVQRWLSREGDLAAKFADQNFKKTTDDSNGSEGSITNRGIAAAECNMGSSIRGLFYIFVGCDGFEWVGYPREQPSHHNQHDISNLKMRSARMLVWQTGHLQVDVIFGMMHL